MEKTKLTIRVPSEFLDGAKQYARAHNTTLTKLVSEYLRQLGVGEDFLSDAPTVQRLTGILPQDAAPDEHREFLEHKYGSQTERPH